MFPQPIDFLQLFATDRRQREEIAAAERLRRSADGHVSTASVPPRTVTSPAAVHTLRPASPHSDCPGREAA